MLSISPTTFYFIRPISTVCNTITDQLIIDAVLNTENFCSRTPIVKKIKNW